MSVVIARLIPTLVCAPALYSRNMTVYSAAALRCMLAPRVSALQNLLIVLINMFLPCLIVLFCFATIFARVRSVSNNVKMMASRSKQAKNANGQFHKALSPRLANQIIMNHSAANTANVINAGATSTVVNSTVLNNNSAKPSTKYSPTSHSVPVSNGRVHKPFNQTIKFSMSLTSMHREIQISKMFAIIFTVFLFG